MYIGLHVKSQLFLSGFNETRNFSTDFSKNTQISSFTKIPPVAAQLFHAGGRTDRHDEAIARFSQLPECT